MVSQPSDHVYASPNPAYWVYCPRCALEVFIRTELVEPHHDDYAEVAAMAAPDMDLTDASLVVCPSHVGCPGCSVTICLLGKRADQ